MFVISIGEPGWVLLTITKTKEVENISCINPVFALNQLQLVNWRLNLIQLV